MTISNTNRTAGPFTGNGISKQFPFSFKVFSRSDVLVAQTLTSTGVESVLLLDGDYTVTLNPSQNTNPGGVISLTSPLPVGSTLAATSNISITQQLDLTNNGGFYPTAINDALDRIVITIQQLAAKVGLGALNVGSAALIAGVLSALTNLASTAGAASVGFLQRGIGAILRTLASKGEDNLTTLDFIPPSAHAAVRAGTSTTDYTAAIQAAIDAAGSTRRLHWIGTVYTGTLSSAASVDWYFESGAKVIQLPGIYVQEHHVLLTGPRIRLENPYFDGNQFNMIFGQGSKGLKVTGAAPTIINPEICNYPADCFDLTSVSMGTKRAMILNPYFHDNAGLGFQTKAAFGFSIIGGSTERNGYGFQKTRASPADASHGFVAFGIAIRLRSNSFTISNHLARDNGRDGININQGSYGGLISSCTTISNDDGGLTFASDNTGSGLPGEGEACRDIDVVDHVSYNSYGSGIAIYQAAHNIRIRGGRCFNNHRLAGTLAPASSYYNGIFVAGGSTGISIDTACYDDRQFMAITAVAGGVLTAPGWLAGAKDFYPKVAIYAGATMLCRGYATITAESAGSVTIAPAAFNGVALGTIVAGDFVTQAVQHNGVFMDNNCQGTVAVEGAGHHISPNPGSSGYLRFSAGFSAGQNIVLPKDRLSATELLVNPTFDVDILNWNFDIQGGGSATRQTASPKKSVAALRLAGGTSPANGDATLSPGTLDAVMGQFIEYSGKVYADARGDAMIYFFWQPAGLPNPISTLVLHPGGGWRDLKVGIQVPEGTSGIIARVGVAPNKVGYFDTMTLRTVEARSDSREFAFPPRVIPG